MTVEKALLVTTVSGFVPQFEMGNVKILQEMGYEVHYASNYHTPSYGKDNKRLDGTGIIRHQVDFVRSPFKFKQNLKVYRQLKCLMLQEKFSLLHCHTPMGGVIARLAAHSTQTGPVIYTAHGFHFFAGASWINWLCYYPMEKFLSRYTDEQICINQEDYQRAKKKFYSKSIDYIPGVGIDLNRMAVALDRIGKEKKRKELGFDSDWMILLSSGELIKRKNHETVIRAIARLKKECSDEFERDHIEFQYVICGHGKLEVYLKELAQKLGVSELVTFLGYREDMLEIYQIADVFLFPSYQEGLPMALLEAMASGLPVLCSDIRGSRDLMEPEPDSPSGICKGGIMIRRANDAESYCRALRQLLKDRGALNKMGMNNAVRAQKFSSECVKKTMRAVYERVSRE